ncbi:Dyp-type peroxidase domain-containing protein [Streptomyces sp. H27-H5]|nr:Dyp-type peroxidase domain-containing protein [Streptomyces sp. H27-H5]MCY0957768.1 Dyp-type peroxidase [Streptomyces sp. H27-H5]
MALGAGPAGLTVTFGFGPELFERLGGGRPSPAG